GDRHQVVAHLVDDHPAYTQRDALVSHTVDLEVGLAKVQRQAAHGLEAGHDERAPAGDDLESEALLQTLVAMLAPGADERLVWLRAPQCALEEQHEQEEDHQRCDCRCHCHRRDERTDVHGPWPPSPSGRADYHSARRKVLDHDDSCPFDDGLSRVGGVGVECFAAASHGNHDLPQTAWTDDSCHPAHAADHLLVKHSPHHPSTQRTPPADTTVAYLGGTATPEPLCY